MKIYRPNEVYEKRTQTMYAIGEVTHYMDHFQAGMWAGPVPDIQLMLDTEGISSNSAIIALYENGTEELLWHWNTDAELWYQR